MELEAGKDLGTLFVITKSENKNEVHYDLQLGKDCSFASEDPIHAYWRDLEISETATSELTIIERSGYGVGRSARSARIGSASPYARCLRARSRCRCKRRRRGGAWRAR
jgi:hypothetical protein